jgi:hypothetical protein
MMLAHVPLATQPLGSLAPLRKRATARTAELTTQPKRRARTDSAPAREAQLRTRPFGATT